MEKGIVTLKLPAALVDELAINIHNHFKDHLRFTQNEAYWNVKKQKWVIDICLFPIDDHLKLRNGA